MNNDHNYASELDLLMIHAMKNSLKRAHTELDENFDRIQEKELILNYSLNIEKFTLLSINLLGQYNKHHHSIVEIQNTLKNYMIEAVFELESLEESINNTNNQTLLKDAITYMNRITSLILIFCSLNKKPNHQGTDNIDSAFYSSAFVNSIKIIITTLNYLITMIELKIPNNKNLYYKPATLIAIKKYLNTLLLMDNLVNVKINYVDIVETNTVKLIEEEQDFKRNIQSFKDKDLSFLTNELFTVIDFMNLILNLYKTLSTAKTKTYKK